jgi:hypothetical protein
VVEFMEVSQAVALISPAIEAQNHNFLPLTSYRPVSRLSRHRSTPSVPLCRPDTVIAAAGHCTGAGVDKLTMGGEDRSEKACGYARRQRRHRFISICGIAQLGYIVLGIYAVPSA